VALLPQSLPKNIEAIAATGKVMTISNQIADVLSSRVATESLLMASILYDTTNDRVTFAVKLAVVSCRVAVS